MSYVACRGCFAPVALDPAAMTVSSFGVVLRCPSCDALVPVRRYDPERGTGTLGHDTADTRPVNQWKLADALGLADRDVEGRSGTDAVVLSFPAPKPRVGPPVNARGATPIPAPAQAPEDGASRQRPGAGEMSPPVDI